MFEIICDNILDEVVQRLPSSTEFTYKLSHKLLSWSYTVTLLSNKLVAYKSIWLDYGEKRVYTNG